MKVIGAKQQKKKFSISISRANFYYYVLKINRNRIDIYMYIHTCAPKYITLIIHNYMLSSKNPAIIILTNFSN